MYVKFQLSGSNGFEDRMGYDGGPKFTLGGAPPLTRPLADKFSHPTRAYDINGVPNFYKGVLRPLHAP